MGVWNKDVLGGLFSKHQKARGEGYVYSGLKSTEFHKISYRLTVPSVFPPFDQGLIFLNRDVADVSRILQSIS